MAEDKFRVLADFGNIVQAHSMRILLEASGLVVQVHGDYSVELGTIERALVLVRETDFELAKTIINEVPPASDVLVPEWACSCGAVVDAGFQVCWACGNAYPKDFEQ